MIGPAPDYFSIIQTLALAENLRLTKAQLQEIGLIVLHQYIILRRFDLKQIENMILDTREKRLDAGDGSGALLAHTWVKEARRLSANLDLEFSGDMKNLPAAIDRLLAQ